MKRNYSLLAVLFCLQASLHAQTDTVNTSNNKLLLSRLREGTSSYLVYTVDSVTKETGYADLWIRSVSFGVRNDKPVVNFGWKWYHNDTLSREVHDVCLKENLKPIYAHTVFNRKVICAFNFTGNFLVAADTVALNRIGPATKVALNPPPYNWQWDMETFSLLPITKTGQKFLIAFLDPFDSATGYYLHEVTGTDNLTIDKDVNIKCWVLRVSAEPGSYEDFWISQKSHDVLKMKGYYKGTYRYKIKLY